MKANDFTEEVARITGEPQKNIFTALPAIQVHLEKHRPDLLKGVVGRLTLQQAGVLLNVLNAAPAKPELSRIPSVLNIGGRGCVQPAATATGAGTVSGPAPKVAPAAEVSTEKVERLARAVFGTLPAQLSRATEPERREQCLRIVWTAHCEAALPPSLLGEVAGYCYKYWRPPGPTGYERSIAAMRKASLKKLASKMNLS